MHIGKRYLNGEQVNRQQLAVRPVKSERVEEIFRRVKRRVEE